MSTGKKCKSSAKHLLNFNVIQILVWGILGRKTTKTYSKHDFPQSHCYGQVIITFNYAVVTFDVAILNAEAMTDGITY